MKKIFILITTIFIAYSTIAQKKRCNKSDKKKNLISICKCKFSHKDKTKKLSKIRNKKKKKNQNVIINLVALKRNLSNKEIKRAKSFSKIDRTPTFKKCANFKHKKRLSCFNKKMASHIKKRFLYPKNDLIKNNVKVWVRFIISKQGMVSNIKAVGPKNSPLLIKEVERVISLLPQFLPGKNKGKIISVKYGKTINFKLS